MTFLNRVLQGFVIIFDNTGTHSDLHSKLTAGRLRLKCDGTRAETRFRLSAKWTSPFKSAGASVQSTTGSQGVRISGSNAGYTKFRSSVKGTGYPLHSPVSPSLPLPTSPCAITFQLDSKTECLPIGHVLRNTHHHYAAHKSPPTDHILSHLNPIHVFTNCFDTFKNSY